MNDPANRKGRLPRALGLVSRLPGLTVEHDAIFRMMDRLLQHSEVTGPGTVVFPGRARTVDMSQALSRVLASLLRERREDALRRGQGQAAPAWVFLTPSGQPLAQQDVREDFGRVLRSAGLPGHFTPHCLRHTFAVQLIQVARAPLPYVQAQLGHASISMTVDVYGRWLPTGNRALVDQLDEGQAGEQAGQQRRALASGRGDQSVTISTDTEMPSPQVIASIGSSAASPSPELVSSC